MKPVLCTTLVVGLGLAIMAWLITLCLEHSISVLWAGVPYVLLAVLLYWFLCRESNGGRV